MATAGSVLLVMRRNILGFVVAAISVAFGTAEVAQAGVLHTVGMSVTKTCPATANEGEIITCTITIENSDPDHGVNNLTVTNQVPFPGGPIVGVVGCAAALTANDGVLGMGNDFTTCQVQETVTQTCTGTSILVVDEVRGSGTDADTGQFAGLPSSGSATGNVTVFCNTPTPTVTDTPTNTPTPTDTNTPTFTPTPTDTNTPSPTPTDTPTRTPTNTFTPTPTDTPTRPPVPLIPSPASPAGAAMIISLGVGLLWALRRFGRA